MAGVMEAPCSGLVHLTTPGRVESGSVQDAAAGPGRIRATPANQPIGNTVRASWTSVMLPVPRTCVASCLNRELWSGTSGSISHEPARQSGELRALSLRGSAKTDRKMFEARQPWTLRPPRRRPVTTVPAETVAHGVGSPRAGNRPRTSLRPRATTALRSMARPAGPLRTGRPRRPRHGGR